MTPKKILAITFLGLILFAAGSVALARTYAELLRDAEILDKNAVQEDFKADELYPKEGPDGVAYKAARRAAEIYRAQAEDARQEAERVGVGGSTAAPPASDLKVTATGSASLGSAPVPDPTFKLIVPIPGLTADPFADPLNYVKGIYNFSIGFGMLIAVAVIVFAGLKWTTSAGNVSAQSEAKDMILNAVLGIVMLLSAVLILKTIDPKLTELTLPGLDPVQSCDPNKDVGCVTSLSSKYAAEFKRLIDEWKGEQKKYDALNKELAALKKACEDKGPKCTKEEKIKILEKDIEVHQQKTNVISKNLQIAQNELLDAEQKLADVKAKGPSYLNWGLLLGPLVGGAKGQIDYQVAVKIAEDNIKAKKEAVKLEQDARGLSIEERNELEKELANQKK